LIAVVESEFMLWLLQRHLLAILAASAVSLVAAEVPLPFPTPSWGAIQEAADGSGRILVRVADWPSANGILMLPRPFPEIISARLVESVPTRVPWMFNLDASRLYLELATNPPAGLPATIELETIEKTGVLTDGRVVFSARDARVQGSRAKLESHPGNHRIGFWLDPADTVSWEYKPTRWGSYDLELTYSAQDGAGTKLQFEIAGKTLAVARPATGSWYRYNTLTVGRIYLEKAQPFTVRVSCPELKGVAVMNLKALTLRPAPEGGPVIQAGREPLILAAAQAITHSVTMRYEPATNKTCLGFWTNPQDWAEWKFSVVTPGTYEVEVWHGAGKLQGGDILVEVNGAKLPFTTVDTGDIHKHTGLRIGRVTFAQPGDYGLSLKPQRKNGGAIMDLSAIKLLPAP
jgi:hypothetical protein